MSARKKICRYPGSAQANQERMLQLKKRLFDLYHVDFTDTSNYTKTIDTTDKNFDQVLEEFEKFIQTLKNGK